MKPKLIHNWPAVQKEQDEVSSILNKVMQDFNQQKEIENDLRKKLAKDDLIAHDTNSHLSRDEAKFGRDSDDIYKERKIDK